MPELPADLYRPALIIVYTLLGAALAVIGYFLRNLHRTIEKELTAQDQLIENVRNDVSNLKSSLPVKYVLRDDFIRAVASLDNKMENIGREVSEINKSLNRLIGGKG